MFGGSNTSSIGGPGCLGVCYFGGGGPHIPEEVLGPPEKAISVPFTFNTTLPETNSKRTWK